MAGFWCSEDVVSGLLAMEPGQTTYLLCGTWLILFDTHAFFHGVTYGVSWTAELISRPTFQQHLREKTEDPQVLAKAARVGGNLGGHRHCPFQPYGGRAAPSLERAGVSCHLGGGRGGDYCSDQIFNV